MLYLSLIAKKESGEKMIVLIIMAIGVWIGFRYFPQKWNKYNSWVQLISIVVLIFCMGVSLGSNPDFISEMGRLGMEGLVFAVVPIIFSIIMVYLLTSKFLKEKKNDHSSNN